MMLLGSSTASVASERSLPMANRLCTDYVNGTFTVENLGDSVAAGHGVPANKRWFNRLAAQLPPNSGAWDGSVGGSLMEMYQPGGQLYFHTEFTKNVGPTVVIMNWRLNEQAMGIQNAGYTVNDFKTRYLAIINDIKAASPNTTVVLAVSPWAEDPQLNNSTQWAFINAMWDVKLQTNSLWLDWMRFANGMLTYDLVHPTVDAQRVMAADAFGLFSGYCKGLTQTG